MAFRASIKAGAIAGIAGACMFLATAAQAGIITETDLATLTADLGPGTTVETFGANFHDGIPGGVLNSQTNTTVADGTPITPGLIQPGATYSTSVATPGTSFNIDGGGGFAPGGFLDRSGSLGPLTVTFDSPVQGFGFDTNELMGKAFTVDIQFSDGSPDFTAQISVPQTLTETGFGFLSSEQDISDVIIEGVTPYIFNQLAFAVDNFTFGPETPATVPEPPSIAIFGAAFAGLIALRRRKHA